ncbi:hypothetical protein [Citricoccus nitrophenolicus]
MIQRNTRNTYRTHYVRTGRAAGRAALLVGVLVIGIFLIALLSLLIGVFG